MAAMFFQPRSLWKELSEMDQTKSNEIYEKIQEVFVFF